MARSNLVACRRSSERRSASASLQALVGCLALTAPGAYAQDADAVLRVCADPNNLPLSNDKGEGYENKIAEELARDLNRRIEYTYFPQRMGFVRNTLRQRDEATQRFKCDVIIGVPKGYELTATTRPYMRSTYALVFASRGDLGEIETAQDLLKAPPEKRGSLRIGVFGRSPGADWLLRNDMLDHAVFYSPQSGDPAESPAHLIEQDLIAGKIDMAIVWGPIAGHLVRRHTDAPAWRAAPFMPEPDIKFDYEISMGVRFGEKEWAGALNEWIDGHQDEVRAILAGFRVPLLDANGAVMPDSQADDSERARARAGAAPTQISPQLDGAQRAAETTDTRAAR
jgi:quinoprotein dehydrogenase-associated probable ABC transporter substrate-binding protein